MEKEDENLIDWKIGDLVLHDCDAKKEYMLMVIVKKEIDEKGTLYHTRYRIAGNYTNQRKVYINEMKFLHHPKRFGIEISKMTIPSFELSKEEKG